MNPVLDWFENTRGWQPMPFQREAWDAFAAGESGLVNAPTGMGKTHAVWLPNLMRWCDEHPDRAGWTEMKPVAGTLLWITPLRALANDTAATLAEPVDELGLPWSIELRTGDTSSTVRKRQRTRLPSALVTTPESLSLLLSYSDARRHFRALRCVVVDEWHELMSSKRGTQTELCLARLRQWNPSLQTWGLSATLGNLEQARDVLLGSSDPGRLIRGEDHKQIAIDTLEPDDVERYPWAGHLGIKLLPKAIDAIEAGNSTLLFTNTRSQVELWFEALVKARPDWLGQVALHHGSLDRKLRKQVEDLLRAGKLKCVVCTSSLDLGVDFSPVDRVIQVGSPKGVARLMQRAGRSGHQPGAVSRIIGVPTHSFELIEFAAARDAAERRDIESRPPLDRPLDVLVQHLVTVAMGGGFEAWAMLEEVRSTYAFADLTDQEWQWCLDFITRGGPALTAYPQYARVVELGDRRYGVASARIARTHRLGIGTITSDSAIKVKFLSGRTLGTVEENFVGYLKPGDRFVFAGHLLELVRVRQMIAYVRKAKGRKATVPRWQGGKSPLSTQLADAVRQRFRLAREGVLDAPEMRHVEPLLRRQAEHSVIPNPDELLIETTKTREGWHHFLYPFLGRLVHEGLGALIAHRLTREQPRSINITVNDYGFELLCADPFDLAPDGWRNVLTSDALLDDLLACIDTTQLARRQFREIARVAGLILPTFPGESRSSRQLQASSDMFYDVLTDFDPGNMLLDQARREVLERQLEVRRLREALDRLNDQTIVPVTLERLSPLSFPLWAEHLREQHVSSEKWGDRVRKMAMSLETQSDPPRTTKRRKRSSANA